MLGSVASLAFGIAYFSDLFPAETPTRLNRFILLFAFPAFSVFLHSYSFPALALDLLC